MIERTTNPASTEQNITKTTNQILDIASAIRDDLQSGKETSTDNLVSLTLLLDTALNIYNSSLSKQDEIDQNQTIFKKIGKTIAFSLTGLRRQNQREQSQDVVDQLALKLQKKIFNLKNHLKQMNPHSTAAQRQLLVLIDDLGQHPYLQAIFDERKYSHQDPIQRVEKLFSQIKLDKASADLTDSFSSENPQFENIQYVYQKIDEVLPRSEEAIKAVIIIAQAIQYEEKNNPAFVNPFGKKHNSSYFWTLSRQLLDQR